MFVPITKIDEEKRLVYGIVTAESPDKSGEICDYETTVPHYKSWSSEFVKVTDGKSLGNIRAMHGKVAVGKAVDLTFDDVNKKISVCAKIVDDNEWKKCLDGVYTGFSQGGSYVKRWDDPKDPALKRYTAKPTEISLVDVPCLPIATFEYVKSDGSVEMRKFHTVDTVEQLVRLDIVAAARGAAALQKLPMEKWTDLVPAVCETMLLWDADEILLKYSDGQERDSLGRWASRIASETVGGAVGASIGGKIGAKYGAIAGGLLAASVSPPNTIGGVIAGRAIGSTVGSSLGGAIGAFLAGRASDKMTEPSDEEEDPPKKKKKSAKKLAGIIADAAETIPLDKMSWEEAVKQYQSQQTLGKSQVKEQIMGQPIKNEQIIEKAHSLAAEAGAPARWADFIPQAHEALEKAAPAGSPAAPAVEDGTATKNAEKKDEIDDLGVRQVWIAKDGTTFPKKADALAKNAELAANPESVIDSAIKKIDDILKNVSPDQKTVSVAEMAKSLEISEYTTETALTNLDKMFSVLLPVITVGVTTDQSVNLKKSANSLKEFISSGLKNSELSLEKMESHLAEMSTSLKKAGARNSAKDMEIIKSIHEHCRSLGVACKDDDGAEKSEKHGDLSKVTSENEALRKMLSDLGPRLEEITTLVQKQADEIKVLKSQPVPPPNLRPVTKGDDVIFMSGDKVESNLTDMLSKLTADQKAEMFIKMSQQSPLSILSKS